MKKEQGIKKDNIAINDAGEALEKKTAREELLQNIVVDTTTRQKIYGVMQANDNIAREEYTTKREEEIER